MEVHAHTHTARKKWTHYFWEFIMLFLAVFCGFLAEYQLEHVIENKREKQFIVSLVSEQEVLVAHEYRTVARGIFNSLVYDKMLDENNISSRPAGNPALLDFSKQDLQDLNFTVFSVKIVVKGMRRDSRKLLQQANDLLATINKAYHLE